jgi:hypothetical protein
MARETDHTPPGVLRNLRSDLDSVMRRLGTMPSGAVTTGTLDPLYRGGGPAKVKIDGVLSTDAYGWATPYVPNGPRLVRLQRANGTWDILGQSTDESVYLDYNEAVVDLYGERSVDTVWNLRPRATKLALSGLVVLSGLFITIGTPASNTVIATLPPGMRPPFRVIHSVEYGDSDRVVRIDPNGDILISPAPAANAYISLDGVAFHPEGVGTWTDVGSGGSSFGANFEAWPGSGVGTPQFYKDPWGFVWFRGLVRIATAPTLDNTVMINMPASHRAQAQSHFRSASEDRFGLIGARTTGGLDWKVGTPSAVGSWISLTGACVVTSDALSLNPWRAVKSYSNSWGQYPGAFTQAGYLRREDGLAITKGLINAGTIGTKMFATIDEEMWPSGGRIIVPAVSNQARARMDVFAARDLEAPASGGPGTMLGRGGSNNWFSLDSLKWVP